MLYRLQMKKRWIFVMLAVLVVGIVFGAVYAVRVPEETDAVLSGYLTSYFQDLQSQNSCLANFKTAFLGHIKLSAILFLCGFLKVGVVGATGCVAVRGFISGFTTASFIKYYGAKGILANLCSLPATVLLFINLIFFASFSANYALNPEKKQKNFIIRLVFVTLICLTIFCVQAFLDGFLTTTFMKLSAHIFVGK